MHAVGAGPSHAAVQPLVAVLLPFFRNAMTEIDGLPFRARLVLLVLARHSAAVTCSRPSDSQHVVTLCLLLLERREQSFSTCILQRAFRAVPLSRLP